MLPRPTFELGFKWLKLMMHGESCAGGGGAISPQKMSCPSSTRSTSSPLPRWLVLRLTGQDGKELLQCQQQQDLLLRVHHRTRPLAAESPEASQTLMGSQTSCLNCGQASSQLKDSLAVWSLSPTSGPLPPPSLSESCPVFEGSGRTRTQSPLIAVVKFLTGEVPKEAHLCCGKVKFQRNSS